MCGCINGLVRSHMVPYDLTRPRTVSHGLSRSCTISNTIIHGHGACVIFFKSFKIIHGFHGYTRMARDTHEWPECNSDKATVGSVVCMVYTDGQPYKPCVLCQTGLKACKMDFMH